MQDLPRPADLVSLVADFLRTELMPVTKGAQNFQLRVAINALELSARQMRGGAASEAAEHARLAALLGCDGSLDDLNRALCERIASGAMTLETPGVAEHLWATTMAKLAVDQPNYASYKRERARDDRPSLHAPHPEEAHSAVSKDGPMR